MGFSMKRNTILFCILTGLLIVLMGISISKGSISVEFREIFAMLTGGEVEEVHRKIIMDIRMPRVVAAVFLGGGLALSGYMLQTFFHNTIAGPFVLGISSGAKFLVAVLMVYSVRLGFYVNSVAMILAALCGSLLVTLFVLMVSAKVKQMSILIVCGVMVGYICSSVTELIISLADDANIVNLHNWAMGSFSAMDWKDVAYYVPVMSAGFVISFILAKRMEAYAYGAEYAASLGMNLKVFRMVLILVSSVLSATVTAFAGPISFVGIAVPHMMRELFRTDRPIIVIPASFIGGGIFCLFSDLLARCLVAPTELSISTITAIFGAPVVIMMLIRKKR